ncbi:MAG: response regulator [Desulfobacteraceae bacterium]|nr:MAG: response regulator [Desulfobacteraceae bacterium]
MSENNEWKIVLVDDEEGIRKVTGIALTDLGYHVETAENGEVGIERCRQFAPHIVITDVKMPGIDGLQLLEMLKQDQPDIEVIVMTAFGDIETAIRAIQQDASDFITKPVNEKALLLALGRAKNRYSSKKQVKEYTRMLETGWSSATKTLLKNFTFQEQIINSAINGIIASGINGKIRIFNPSAGQMLGYDKDDVAGKKRLKDLFANGEEERLQDALDSELYGGVNRINLMEALMRDRDAVDVPVQISASVLFDEGEKNGLLICIRDLRELQRIERKMADQEKILHQDKMMSLGKLAASVVHEINNPLSGILNYLRLMAKGLEKATFEKREKFAKYLDISMNETDRVSRIVSNLLTFSRKSAISYEAVNVKDLIGRCALLSQHKLELQNILLHVDVEPDIPDIRADANQIQQCVINLLFNAMDAVQSNGEVGLSASFDRSKERVLIHVKDTGAGIPEQDLPYIFEPFFTTKDEGYGVGLGLSTVYGIMETHGGAVRVENTSKSGTHFVLEFNTLATG